MQTSKITTVGYVKPEIENYVESTDPKSLDVNPLSFKKKDKKDKKNKKKEAQLQPKSTDQEQTAEKYLERARGEESEGTIEKGLSQKQEKQDTPYKNLEGQLRLTSNYLNLDGMFDSYWSK